MIGLAAHPASTLADRALALLADGPASSARLAREVMGLAHAPDAVADRLAVALLGADPRVCRLPDLRWGLVTAARGGALLDECAFAVVDVETTGSRARGDDRITEVGVVVVHGARCEVVFDRLVNPGRPIPPRVSAITGITDAMVARAPTFEEIADELLGTLSGRVFVAHNARFDWAFLNGEFRRTRGLALESQRLCTVRLARRLVRGVESCALDSLMHWFGLENPARHRAAGDALVTARLLTRLIDLARGHGARTIADLEAIQARRGRRTIPSS
ncbi:MAG: PolC-type DNA polymerase III [Gemmatimonadota bacterium]